MPATTKSELMAATELEFQKLEKLLTDVHRDEALLKDDEETSIKDVVAHRAHWIELFLGWYEDGQAGKEVFFPARGYKWNQLKAYNAALRVKQRRMSWRKAREVLQASHDRLVAFIAASSNAALYGGPMKGGNNNWPTGRWAEAAGPSHYRSAGKYIRSRLKEMRQ